MLFFCRSFVAEACCPGKYYITNTPVIFKLFCKIVMTTHHLNETIIDLNPSANTRTQILSELMTGLILILNDHWSVYYLT